MIRPLLIIHILSLSAVILAGAPAVASDDEQDLLDEQRQLFRLAYERAELGDWRIAAKHEAVLSSYVLWPDLRAAWLKTRVRNDDYADVDVFLDQHGILKPARELRYHYALSLGDKNLYPLYLGIYQSYYQGLEIAKLDCLAFQAELAAGRQKRIVNRGLEKWLVGKNQVDECDPVFEQLRASGVIGEPEIRRRFELAIEAREFALARYLSRSLPQAHGAQAQEWTALASNPADYIEQHDVSRNSESYREQLVYAAERVAYRQPDTAAVLWRIVADQYPFSDLQRNYIERHVALWAARRHSPDAYSLLSALADDAVDVEVQRWQARTALQDQDWKNVASAIRAMPEGEREDEQWLFWSAYALEQTGETASEQLLALTTERSFYGFLAADMSGLDYDFSDIRVAANDTIIDALEHQPQLIRARELFFVGLEGRGRSEWDSAIAMLSAEQKKQASILAHRWGWHSRAIATMAQGGNLDDLEIRYPLPYRQMFEKHASASNIKDSWAYGVARSESLFMRDIRSSAGAIGLMQLMPETGRRTAKKINLPYSGHATLTDPDSNIRLGTTYMRMMLERFDDNPVLATAAYNAGPLNVEDWLPAEGSVDALIWIENIPYNETRKYVRRVLATDVVFHWRLTGELHRISPHLVGVSAPEQVAGSD